LIILRVLPPFCEKSGNEGDNVLHRTIMSELRHLAHSVGAESCGDVEVKVLYGNPADQILAESTSHRTDLIVMQTNDHPEFHNFLHDHTIYGVLAHTECPVLTLHNPAELAIESCSGEFAMQA
jgi:nucleotide-binding universal stress UspA family protein